MLSGASETDADLYSCFHPCLVPSRPRCLLLSQVKPSRLRGRQRTDCVFLLQGMCDFFYANLIPIGEPMRGFEALNSALCSDEMGRDVIKVQEDFKCVTF